MGKNNNGDFNLQKARLMARFSSVAYEDPPKNAKRNTEQFIDSFGMSITRPIIEYAEIFQNGDRFNSEDDRNVWDMAHVNAMSPRPLMPMFSECNTFGNNGMDGLTESQFQWIQLATNKETSAQFDVWRITSAAKEAQSTNSSKNTLVIAFRGTQLSSYLDLLTNIQLKQDMISCSDFGVCMDGDDAKEEMVDGLMVHSGFLKAYSSIRPTLLQLLSDNASNYDHIWFTGHSLGAALATLAVVDVGSILNNASSPITIKSMRSLSSSPIEQTLNLPKAKIFSYLFGTPRAGNQEFANRLARLQHQPGSVIQEYYRINTTGDAVVFLPRGRSANRLNIDYVHAGSSVFLPALFSENQEDDDAEGIEDTMNESYSRWMMQLEEDTVEQINTRIFQSGDRYTATDASTDTAKRNNIGTNIRIYPKGDQPPDPLSEVDPQYTGFFPVNPLTWISSKSFQNFLLGETVRSFRVLRGGFVKNHKLATYEDGLCLASQDNVMLINPL